VVCKHFQAPREALALQWDDLDGVVLRVRRALVSGPGRQLTVSTTKTGRARSVPLGESAIRLLRDHRKLQAERRLFARGKLSQP
jgi:integrase